MHDDPRLDRVREAASALLAIAPQYGPVHGTPLREADLLAFEAAHGVRLPPSFRAWLLAFGDGALCPRVLGLRALPLARCQSDPIWATFGGPMRADFGYAGTDPIALDWDEEADDYTRMDHLRGTLCLGSAGCDLVRILVVTGRAAGTVWTFVPGLEHALNPTGLDFLDWCIEGLQGKRQELARLLR